MLNFNTNLSTDTTNLKSTRDGAPFLNTVYIEIISQLKKNTWYMIRFTA